MAVCPLSEQLSAPRTPNPFSKKYTPLRDNRPNPSKSSHLINRVSTPPCKIRSSTNFPTSFRTNALTMALRLLKHFLKALATLYSPPPSQTLKDLAVLILPSPGYPFLA